MSLTLSQRENLLAARESLAKREIVLLSGKSDGKTTLLHEALSVIAQRDEEKRKNGQPGLYSGRQANEVAEVEFFTRIYWPRSDKITLVGLMRQIVQFAGVPIKPYCATAEVVNAFEGMLREASKQKLAVCLAIDNAEMLPKRAYTMMKALNEYHDAKSNRRIGTAILLAGEIASMKNLPLAFFQRCRELQVVAMSQEEIANMIRQLYPNTIKYWDDQALVYLMKSKTTLEARSVIDKCSYERERYDLSKITADIVEDALYEKSETRILAKAA